jgi:dTDP-4-amino-4,6-dideoxygalactose transaminase
VRSSAQALLAAFDSGWIAPVGPDLDAFEAEVAARADRRYAVGLASGTAALHLGLLAMGSARATRCWSRR